MLPSLGRADLAAPSQTVLVRSTGAGAELAAPGVLVAIPGEIHRDAYGWQALRPLTASVGGVTIQVVIDDLDPYRLPGAAVGGRLGASEAACWQSLFSKAWDLLVRHHWTAADEIQAIVARTRTARRASLGPAERHVAGDVRPCRHLSAGQLSPPGGHPRPRGSAREACGSPRRRQAGPRRRRAALLRALARGPASDRGPAPGRVRPPGSQWLLAAAATP